MREEKEVQNQLLNCKEKRSYWRDTMWRTENNESWEGEYERAERNYQIWHERVKTLEFVLGINDII